MSKSDVCNFQVTSFLKDIASPSHFLERHVRPIDESSKRKMGRVKPQLGSLNLASSAAFLSWIAHLPQDCYVRNKLLSYLSHFNLRSLCNSALAIIPKIRSFLLACLSNVFLRLDYFNSTSILCEPPVWWGGGFQSMAPRPAGSSSPGNLLNMWTC